MSHGNAHSAHIHDNNATPATPPDNAGLTPQPFPNAAPGLAIHLVISLRRMLLKLADWIVPADAAVFERVIGIGQTQVVGAIARHRIPDLLLDGPLTAADIAARTGTHPDAMHRTLRAAATSGIFHLSQDGRFANNRLSLALRSGQLTRAREFAEYFSSGANCAAYCAFDHTLRTGQESFAPTLGFDLWEWFDAHPDEREVFAQTMMGVTISEAPMVAKLYPFDTIQRICDVGGGRGTLLSELLVRFPQLEGVLFDREGVIASAKPLLAARGVNERVETVVGDFFEHMVPGCDAYLLKNVLHDWDDERCKIILRHCRAAMQIGHRLLVVEIVVEPNDHANFGAFRDIHVMVVCNGGRERSLAEYRALLESSGFEYTRVYHSPIISVIEAIAH